MSLVSIIMPVYNSEKTIKKSIESVLRQTCNNWELIAVDDGSTDSSLQVLNEYSEKYEQIKVFSQKNAGPGEARNFGISKATGDYIAFLDSDDWWDRRFIELVNEKIITDGSDVIFYDLVREEENGKLIKESKLSIFRNLPKNTLIRYQMTGKMEWGMVKVIRRCVIVDNDLKFSTDSVGEEAVFSFSVLSCSKKISFIDVPVYHYVLFADGQHKKGEYDPWGNIVLKMREHVSDIGESEKYGKTINSFALRALCISCYRIAINHSRKDAVTMIKAKIKEYSGLYNLRDIEKDVLDKATCMLYPFIMLKMAFPIYLASKIRERGR
ncbi:MAG: glycosyltransferase family 2 protein [Eubacteriales bacterium]